MFKVAIITSSDSGYKGEREDISGLVIRKIVELLTFIKISYNLHLPKFNFL